MVEGFAAGEGGGDEDPEVVLDLLLPDEVVEARGAQGAVEVLFGGARMGRGGHEAGRG